MQFSLMIALLCAAKVIVTKCEDSSVNFLLRQVMALQNYIEEQARTGTGSGIKQIRVFNGGTKPYFYDDHTGKQMAAIHNHANNIDTIGMGEVVAVLNGVEFRTRHNDYKLVMPHRTLNGFKDNENIPFPDVPPEVLKKTTVEEQITEMREFFKAFKEQNTRVRNYKPYFKPVLCYMEGAWMSSTDSIDEPFDSDRHFIDASSWLELQEKIQFFSYAGGKNPDENLAFLPTRIVEVNNNSAVLAQWNYRIRCAPVSLDTDGGLNLNRFRVVDDLTTRVSNSRSLTEHAQSRAARFQLGYWRGVEDGRHQDKKTGETLLDMLMSQIPGYDNYNQFLADDVFGVLSQAFNHSTLNSAYYHRLFRVDKADAMGVSRRSRSYSDQNVYMAQNTQPNIPGARYKGCSTETKNSPSVCRDVRQKWSWAFPLEIIYLTPLLSWNPYDFPYRVGKDENLVFQGGRRGGLTPDKAYNGNAKKAYFRTPKEFFADDTDTDSADTGNEVVGVLDKNGQVKEVRSSGTRIFLPEIPGVGAIRTRWPIAPLANEGNQILKELDALKDIVIRMSSYADLLEELPPGGEDSITKPPVNDITLRVDESTKDPPHSHSFTLNTENIQDLKDGKDVIVDTTEDQGHNHRLVLRLTRNRGRLRIFKCDGLDECQDGHSAFITDANKYLNTRRRRI